MTAQRAGALDGLFDWWLQELREARAALVERYSSLRAPRFELRLFADHAVLVRGEEQRPFKFDASGWPALEEIWTGAKPRNARIDLVLPEASVLAFELRLPPLADHKIKAAVELQLERKLPLPREQLYVDWEAIQKHADRSRTIAVAAVRRAQVDAWQARLRVWPWRLGRVQCKAADGRTRFHLTSRSLQRVSFTVGPRERLLSGVAAGLAIGFCIVTAGQWIYERMSLAETIDAARTQVAEMSELRARVEQESRPLIAIRQAAQLPSADRALQALSSTLPAQAWLYQTEIRATPPAAPIMTIEGFAPSAAMLVQALEQAQQFERIQLLETSAGEAGLNRIKLRAQLQSGARP